MGNFELIVWNDYKKLGCSDYFISATLGVKNLYWEFLYKIMEFWGKLRKKGSSISDVTTKIAFFEHLLCHDFSLETLQKS